MTDEHAARSDMRHDNIAIAALALAPAIGLGIARFAYSLVLPDMRADLGWSYADAGWMNASNAAGYLLGAVLVARAIAAFGAFRVMAAGVWICVVALALCAVSSHALPLNAARLSAGFGGALAFVSGGVLSAGVAHRNPGRAAFLLGIFYAGAGVGIVASGLAVPFVLDWLGPGSWRVAWAVLAALSVPLALGVHAARGESAVAPSVHLAKARYGDMLRLLAGYFAFGGGYIAYMTFVIAQVRGSGGGAAYQALFWTVIGVATMAWPWLWTVVLKRCQHGYAFSVLNGITALGAALPLLSDSLPMLLVSAALFGSAFFAVVAGITAFVRRNYPQAQWASALGFFTVIFGIGQILGPVAAGLLNDLRHDLSGGLWASVVLLMTAAVLGAVQRDRAAA